MKKYPSFLPTLALVLLLISGLFAFASCFGKPAPFDYQVDDAVDSKEETLDPSHVHTWGNWTVLSEPTKTEGGEWQRACACGETESKYFSAIVSTMLSYWVKEDGTCAVTGIGHCLDEELYIPSSFGGYTVTEISSHAFLNCTQLKRVVMPDTIRTIGIGAFEGCTSLISVSISDNVYNISSYAFFNCSSLASVSLPASLCFLGSEVFRNTAITELLLPENFMCWETHGETFVGATSLENIFVDPQNPHLQSIDGNLYSKDGKELVAYAPGKQATSFVVPDSVKRIQTGAFHSCKALKSITLPDSVHDILDFAFYGCTALEQINLPPELLSIGTWAFSGCCSLTEVTVPKFVTAIGYGAFSDCTALRNITLPSALQEIPGCAFKNCFSLIEITIPKKVTYIGGDAFRYCTGLTEVIIPDGVTNISYTAFCGCSSLQSISIPKSVKKIEHFALQVQNYEENAFVIIYVGTAEEWSKINKPEAWNGAMTVICSDQTIIEHIEVDYWGK